MNKKAIIAMSGGVDSSVAAFLTKNDGYDCIGATMKLFNNDEVQVARENSCCSLEDVEDARSVAHSLGIPYYVFNFTDRFREDVIERFVHAYETGATPNPCIDCNRYLKFEKLFLRARELNYDYVVTGHYARIEYDGSSGRYLLKKAVDETKDQSYV
ncbi:MAG: tRNA 2-thiouridine(34) synthase MnmA, partial [Clostridia bacterium]|nr:tRNA 2-thiouridine(34) synthase MnmA [Clostridia bacterium]